VKILLQKNSAASFCRKTFLPQEGFCPQVCRTELKKKTEIRELIADKDWKKLGWVWEEIEKTGIGLEKDRNSATMGYIPAAFLNDTVCHDG